MRKAERMLLELPQVIAGFEEAPEIRQVLVLGGRAPEPSWLQRIVFNRVVYAADRGAEACKAAGILPIQVLGDFDSINEDAKAWLDAHSIELERYPADKDETDFQLCLSRVHGDLLVTGCWGGRFDHAFSNIFSALWGRKTGANVRVFADETEALFLLFDGESLELDFKTRPLAISLLPLGSRCNNVDIRGVKWELCGAELLQAYPCAVSNVPENGRVFVNVGEGVLGVYCYWE